MELVKVQSSSTTIKARAVALVALGTTGVLGWLGLSSINEDVQFVILHLTDPRLVEALERIYTVAKWVGLAITLLAALLSALPAWTGWMTRDREKPLEDLKQKAVGPPAGLGLVLCMVAAGFLLAGCSAVRDDLKKVTGRLDWSPFNWSKYDYRGDEFNHGQKAAFDESGQIIGSDGYVESKNGTLPQWSSYSRPTAPNRVEFGWRVLSPPPVVVPPAPAPVKVLTVEK